MNEGKKSEEGPRLPAQQAHQPQPSVALDDHDCSQEFTSSDLEMVVSKNADKERQVASGGRDGKGDSSEGLVVDDARFTAGVAKLYETLLKEPIPDEMLRLIDELGKQERK